MASIAERVNCYHCGAAESEPCRTANGGPVRSTHAARWSRLRDRMRHGLYVVRIKSDDDHIGVKAGEEYIAQTYWLDPGKVTLLARVPDGHDPECNEYRSNVEWVRWAEATR